MTSGSLTNYNRDEMNDVNEINANNCRTDNGKTAKSDSFEYNTEIIGRIPDDNNTLKTEVAASVRYLSNFWRALEESLI